MHAYAADDPVFVALNSRMQQDTGGTAGDFCIRCHAPMAIRRGATQDGTNVAGLPRKLKGITCYFCHSASNGFADHNNPLITHDDRTMRAAIDDPDPAAPHGARSSAAHDHRISAESSRLCGSCHDIENRHGVLVERTFQEWQSSAFAAPGAPGQKSCGACHMQESEGTAAALPGLPTRRLHDHSWPAVDTALIDFPDKDRQRSRVQELLETAITLRLCVDTSVAGAPEAVVTIDNTGVGHSFPSGAAQDRRLWVELRAWVGETVVFSSGSVTPQQPLDLAGDPGLFVLRDDLFDANDQPTAFVWQARRVEPHLLGPRPGAGGPIDAASIDPQSRTHRYGLGATVPDSVEAVVHVRPFALDVLRELVDSQLLDAQILASAPTLTLETSRRRWRIADGACAP